ncbi:hypothetical protein DFH06DRAFT_1322847 [Mycena polygramma]|nr:hypothetical protein DFH06DRAFT_1322847 [Mycena polygramma]
MSIRVNGWAPLSVVRTSLPETEFSSVFLAAMYPAGHYIPPWLPVTMFLDTGDTYTVILRTKIVAGGGPDVYLGLDFKASVQHLMLSLGWTFGPGFDLFRRFLPAINTLVPEQDEDNYILSDAPMSPLQSPSDTLPVPQTPVGDHTSVCSSPRPHSPVRLPRELASPVAGPSHPRIPSTSTDAPPIL